MRNLKDYSLLISTCKICKMVIVIYTVLWIIPADAVTLKLGVLLPFSGRRPMGRTAAGAVTKALQDAEQDPSLSALWQHGVNFR